MGEEGEKAEEKKMEEKKVEEGKKEEPKGEKAIEEKKEDKKAVESKETAAAVPLPLPPQEVVLKVFMHCEGCARKIRRCLKGFEGVESVQTDCTTHKVVVKGEKADPVKVLERVQKKSHRKVELLSPIPKPPPPEDVKKAEEKVVPKPEEKKEEPQVITVILKVHMHCEACAQEIKRRLLKMKGVENVEPDLKTSQVIVKGVFDASNLVEYIHKRTGKHAVIVKRDSEKKEEGKVNEKKADDEGGDKKDEGEDKKDEEAVARDKKDDGGEAVAVAKEVEEVVNMVEPRKNEYYYNYPQQYQIYHYPQRFEVPPHAPQMFSDENPNACSVM